MKVVFVTGMHRSGTSLVASLLDAMGVNFGAPERHIPAGPDNPRGFWEFKDVVLLNDELLSSAGATWDDPPSVHIGFRKGAMDHFRPQAHHLLGSELGPSGGVVGLKDPRFCFTLPAWRRVSRGPVVGCLRDARAVAQSLQSRNGLTVDQSLALWLRYQVSLAINEGSTIYVRYEDVLSDPEQVVSRLKRALGLPNAGDTSECAALVEQSLDHAGGAADVGGPLIGLADYLHRELPLLRAMRRKALARRLARLLEQGTVADWEREIRG